MTNSFASHNKTIFNISVFILHVGVNVSIFAENRFSISSIQHLSTFECTLTRNNCAKKKNADV